MTNCGHNLDLVKNFGYMESKLSTGHKCLVRVDDDLYFRCTICKDGYQHYIVSDRLWNTIPEDLRMSRRLYLCPSCFAAVRFMAKFQQK